MDPPDDNQREIRDAMERRRKARDVQYQLQQIVEDKDIGEKDKEAPEIQNPRREETSHGRLITFGYPNER